MKAVDVLRDERKFPHAAFELSEREVTGVGLGRGDVLAAPCIPVPDELGIARKRARCRKLARIEVENL